MLGQVLFALLDEWGDGLGRALAAAPGEDAAILRDVPEDAVPDTA
jgi:hypothetical protein